MAKVLDDDVSSSDDSSSEDDDLLGHYSYHDECPDTCEDGSFIHVYKNNGGRKPKCSSCDNAPVWVKYREDHCGFYYCSGCKKRYHKFISKTERRVRNVQQWFKTR
jgi:hypothetical protein